MNTKILKGKNFPVRTTLKNEPESGLSVFGFGFFVDREEEKRQLAKREDDARHDESRYMRRVAAYNELRGYTHHVFIDTNVICAVNGKAMIERMEANGFSIVLSSVSVRELKGLENSAKPHVAANAKWFNDNKERFIIADSPTLLTGEWGEKIYKLFRDVEGKMNTRTKAASSYLNDRKIEVSAYNYLEADVERKIIFVSDDKDMTSFIENMAEKLNRGENFKKLTTIGLEKLLARIDDLRSTI